MYLMHFLEKGSLTYFLTMFSAMGQSLLYWSAHIRDWVFTTVSTVKTLVLCVQVRVTDGVRDRLNHVVNVDVTESPLALYIVASQIFTFLSFEPRLFSWFSAASRWRGEVRGKSGGVLWW